MNKDVGVAEVSRAYLIEAAKRAVPVGYKQTEVGVIPEDWELLDINAISLVPMQNGIFFEPKRKGFGIPLINVGDMYKSAPIEIEGLELFSATLSEVKAFRVFLVIFYLLDHPLFRVVSRIVIFLNLKKRT